MNENVSDTLRSLPSIGGATLTAAGEVAHWWALNDQTQLRLVNVESQSIETIPINAFDPHGWESLIEVAGGIVVNSNPETYLVTRDGALSEFLPEAGYTQIHDVDPSGHRVLYVHYGDPWTLRVYDQRRDDTRSISKYPEQRHHAGFSRDGEHIAYRRNLANDFGAGSVVVAASDGDREWEGHIGDPETATLLHDWGPDGSKLLISDRTTDTYRVGVYDWQRDESTWLTESDWPEYGVQFTPDGTRVLAVRHRDGTDLPILVDLDEGEVRALSLPDGVVNRSKYATIRRFLDEETFLLEHQSGTHPPRLLTYDLRTDDSTVLVETGVDIPEEPSFVDSEYVWYESTDGLEIGAVLYDSGVRPSPAVVVIHGGPTRSEKRDFDLFAQMLVNHGYTVLKPNYRGSTDRGREFEEAIRGDVGGGEVEDVAAGARWLAARDWIDENRIAAYGRSHGALNAGLQAVRFSDRYGVVFVSNGYLEFTNDPDEANTYAKRHLVEESGESFTRERSVVERADEIECPICLIWGGQDHGQEALGELITRLDDRGWRDGEEYRLEVFRGEGHEIQDKEALWSLVVDELETRMGPSQRER